MRQLITRAVVARELGVSIERVRQLDDVLHPRRSETGVRLYDPERVDAFAGARAERRRLR